MMRSLFLAALLVLGLGAGAAEDVVHSKVIGTEYPGKYKHPAAITQLDNGDVKVVTGAGELTVAMVGLFLPFVALVGALRLAKPTSAWARRRYQPESSRLRRSEVRFGAAYQRRWQRVHDLIGGAPSPDQQPQPAGRPGQEQRP